MSKTDMKKKGGRPRVDTDAVTLRLHASVLAQIDEYRRNLPDLPNRQEAIRRLLRLGMEAAKNPDK